MSKVKVTGYEMSCRCGYACRHDCLGF